MSPAGAAVSLRPCRRGMGGKHRIWWGQLVSVLSDGCWSGWLLGIALLITCTLLCSLSADTSESCAICYSKLEVMNGNALHPTLSELGEMNSNLMEQWSPPLNPDLVFVLFLFLCFKSLPRGNFLEWQIEDLLMVGQNLYVVPQNHLFIYQMQLLIWFQLLYRWLSCLNETNK